MQNNESVPIEVFVVQILSTKVALQIIEHWPLKSEAIINTVIKHYQDIGIYQVSPAGQSEVLKDSILFYLKNSPQIIDMIDKAKRAALAATQRGRSNQNP